MKLKQFGYDPLDEKQVGKLGENLRVDLIKTDESNTFVFTGRITNGDVMVFRVAEDQFKQILGAYEDVKNQRKYFERIKRELRSIPKKPYWFTNMALKREYDGCRFMEAVIEDQFYSDDFKVTKRKLDDLRNRVRAFKESSEACNQQEGETYGKEN